MLRTATIKLNATPEQFSALLALRAAYADACNRLVPIVVEHRCWNRVALHQRSYSRLRAQLPLGSQMTCNAIFSVCKAYRTQLALGRIGPGKPIPFVHFKQSSIHYDKRTYRFIREGLSLYTLRGRVLVGMRLGEHQRRILKSGDVREADLVLRGGKWFFNVAVQSNDPESIAIGPVMGVDIGEVTLAATSTGKVFGGEALRDQRDRYLARRRRLQSNGSQSAKQKLRQVSGKEKRRAKQMNHETSKAIVAEAVRHGIARIAMEDLTHIRARISAGRRLRGRLHRWSFRQLQSFIEYKARAVGIGIIYVDPAYTSKTCSSCAALGKRLRHSFVCDLCGLRAHSDLNASRNLARIGGTAVPPRVAVNTPYVGNLVCRAQVSQ